jgi:NTP pyrophosphatase (non-canonical NTP hydrolase)
VGCSRGSIFDKQEGEANQMVEMKIIMKVVHELAIEKGWWNEKEKRNKAEMIALMHSELSEAIEALRHGDPPSEHIPDFSGVEEEMADIVIRVFDFCEGFGYRLEEAIEAKFNFNEGREHRHGGKLF